MAFGAQKIFPIDTKPGTAVGVAIPFNTPGVFYSTYTTKDAVRNNLINFFLTNKNERYLNPNFGGNLRGFIFEQITDSNLDSLKDDIQSQLNLFFPNVIIGSLDLFKDPDYNTVTVSLKYNVLDTVISDEILIAFN